jgi:roadblock/LC7 domain-containing protein
MHLLLSCTDCCFIYSLSFLITSKLLQLDAAVASSQLRSAAKLIYYAAFAAAYALAGAAADLEDPRAALAEVVADGWSAQPHLATPRGT